MATPTLNLTNQQNAIQNQQGNIPTLDFSNIGQSNFPPPPSIQKTGLAGLFENSNSPLNISNIGSTLGMVGTDALGAALAPETGGLSLGAAAALSGVGGALGGAAGEAARGALGGDNTNIGNAAISGGEAGLAGPIIGKAWDGVKNLLNPEEASTIAKVGQGTITPQSISNTKPGLLSKIAGIATSIPADTIQRAYNRPSQIEDVINGKVNTMDILSRVREALSNLTTNMNEDYTSKVNGIAQNPNTPKVSLNSVKTDINNIAGKFGGTVIKNPTTGQFSLSFSPLTSITQTSDRNALLDSINLINNNDTGNFKDVNALKQRVHDYMNNVTPGGTAEIALNQIYHSLDNALTSQVPGMAGINAEYSARKTILDGLSGKMNGLSGESNLNTLLNSGKSETQQLFDSLSSETGNSNIVDQLKDLKAGNALKQILPPTGSRPGDIIKGLLAFGAGGPLASAGTILSSSPYVIGKVATAAGKIASKGAIPPIVGDIGGIAGKYGLSTTSSLLNNQNSMNPQNSPSNTSLSTNQEPQSSSTPSLDLSGSSSNPLNSGIQAIQNGQPLNQSQYQALMEKDLTSTGGRFQNQITAAYQAGNPTGVQGLSTATGATNRLTSLFNQAGGAQGLLGNISNAIGNTKLGDTSVKSYNEQATALGQEIISQVYGSSGTSTDRNQILSLIPQINDTPQTAQNKIDTLRMLINQRLSSMTGSTPASVNALNSPSLSGITP